MATEQENQSRKVITSFMLRFVREAKGASPTQEVATMPPAATPKENWRGVVKHIQSGAEQHFTTLAEAEGFIKKYIEDDK